MYVLSWQTPELKALEQVAVFFSHARRDGSETPVLVRLVEFGSGMPECLKLRLKCQQLRLIARRQMDVAGMVIARATMGICVFDCCMSSLHSLLRERNVSSGDSVEIGLLVEVLCSHDKLTSYRLRFDTWCNRVRSCVGLKDTVPHMAPLLEQF